MGGTDWECDGICGIGDEFDCRGRDVYRVSDAAERHRGCDLCGYFGAGGGVLIIAGWR
jgi:hypothetical protein